MLVQHTETAKLLAHTLTLTFEIMIWISNLTKLTLGPNIDNLALDKPFFQTILNKVCNIKNQKCCTFLIVSNYYILHISWNRKTVPLLHFAFTDGGEYFRSLFFPWLGITRLSIQIASINVYKYYLESRKLRVGLYYIVTIGKDGAFQGGFSSPDVLVGLQYLETLP